MKLLPFTRLAFETDLSRDEVVHRIKSSIRPLRPWWYLRFGRQSGFEGRLSPNGFKLRRIIRYWNSFLPIAYGRFVDQPGGRTRIEVVLTLHPAVAVFCVFWTTGVVVGLVGTIVQWWRSGEANAMAAPFGMLVFFYLLVMIGWGTEVRRASQFITCLLRHR